MTAQPDPSKANEAIASQPEPILKLEHVQVAYSQRAETTRWAVNDISLDLYPGERLGLVGESGCGKSTLGRAVIRLLPPQAQLRGRVEFNGRSVLGLNPSELRRFRGEAIGLVFQDPMTRLDPLMTIGEHCVETLRCHQPQLSRRQAKDQAMAVLERVKIPAARWQQYPHEFSGGMRQRVAIALALMLTPRLIVADEPTTSLDVTVAAEILQELRDLCAVQQTALILISHDLAMVATHCDRLAVMYQGQLVEAGKTQAILQSPQHEYTQTLLRSALHIHRLDPSNALEPTSESTASRIPDASPPLLRLLNVQQHYTLESNWLERWRSPGDRIIRAVDGVTLDLFDGETLGLVGESGCGKSTLSRTILQLQPPTAGRVEFLGRNLADLPARILRRQRRQMQMIFQDPHACLNPLMRVGESIADPLRVHQLADGLEAHRRVLAMLERVGLTPAMEFHDRFPSELSGGQQQRVAIARALITQPRLVICDEPVSMLDATVQRQVLELMQSLKQDFNLTYLFITHDLAVARFFCDRIAVMQAGQIVEIGQTETLFSQPRHPYTKTLLAAAPLLELSA